MRTASLIVSTTLSLSLLSAVLLDRHALAQPAPEQPSAAGSATPDQPPAPPPASTAPAPITLQLAPTTLPALPPHEHEPLAGYANGGFFLRDPHDWFVLYPKGRLQIDWFNFLNRGPAPATGSNGPDDKRPKDTIFVRRARVEVLGTIIGHFDFSIAGEFATTPATGSYGTFTDCFIIADYLSFLKLQAGVFDAPFTLENRTSDKYFDFMERSLAVRAFGVPSNKEAGAMLFGWLPRHFAYYSLGLFNGDGQTFKNQDNNPAIIGRAFVSPLAPFAGDRRWMQDMWVGASVWWQQNSDIGGAVTPNTTGAAQNDIPTMTTQGGFGFFSTNYNNKDAAGNTVRSHLVPHGETLKWALEANLPFKWIGARFELVHQSVDLAEYNDANPMNATLTRSFLPGGRLDGFGYYVELYGWILGDMSFLETPGLESAPRLKKFAPVKEPRWGLMVAAKYEHLQFDVRGLTSLTDSMGKVSSDPAAGYYQVDAFELGVNAWGTKHVRLSGNYIVNFIDGNSSQVEKNIYFKKAEHELLFRLAIAL